MLRDCPSHIIERWLVSREIPDLVHVAVSAGVLNDFKEAFVSISSILKKVRWYEIDDCASGIVGKPLPSLAISDHAAYISKAKDSHRQCQLCPAKQTLLQFDA